MTTARQRGMPSAQIAILVNAGLAIVKLFAGVVGHTYALIADAAKGGNSTSADSLNKKWPANADEIAGGE